MSIKKAFVPLIDFLKDNQDKKVKSVLAEVEEMCAARGAGGVATTIVKDPNSGEVVGKRCGYYKKWMPLAFVEFGQKQGAADGLNPFCKEGMSHYSRQNREFKSFQEELLQRVASGEVPADEIEAQLAKAEAERTKIVPRADGFGYDTSEELLEALADGSAQAQYDEYIESLEAEANSGEAEEAVA